MLFAPLMLFIRPKIVGLNYVLEGIHMFFRFVYYEIVRVDGNALHVHLPDAPNVSADYLAEMCCYLG